MWTCSKCAAKVDDDFDVCWQCGTNREGVEDPNFVRADEAPPIEDPIYDPIANPDLAAIGGNVPGPGGAMVEAYQAFSLMEAKFLADQLTAANIPAMSDTQDMQDALGTLQGNPRVYVRAEDHQRARAWLAEYDARRAAEPEKRLEP